MKLLRNLFVLFLSVALISFIIVEYITHTPIITKNNLHYLLKPGVTTRTIASDLYKTTHLSHPVVFRLIARLKGVDHKLQAGEYIFPKGSSIHSILKQLEYGRVVYYNFTIVNGWNIWEVMSNINKQPFIQHTMKNLMPIQIAQNLGIKQATAEGLLYPETYRYSRGTTDLSILKQAHQLMLDKMKIAWANRAKDLWYKNPYQALIVASMIEKETALSTEKPMIAAVILKRLEKWMHLQIDATVIYGLGPNFTKKLTIQDLQHKTSYNTYENYGLPPTPISMPGQESIDAALHPAKTEVLYFVSKGDGSHVFSQTLSAHDQQTEKYQIKNTGVSVKSNTLKNKKESQDE